MQLRRRGVRCAEGVVGQRPSDLVADRRGGLAIDVGDEGGHAHFALRHVLPDERAQVLAEHHVHPQQVGVEALHESGVDAREPALEVPHRHDVVR